MPSVMRLIGALGGLDDAELRATFNGGLGMVVAVPPAGGGRGAGGARAAQADRPAYGGRRGGTGRVTGGRRYEEVGG